MFVQIYKKLFQSFFQYADSILLGLCVFFLFTYTAPPSIFVGDSGDMTTAAALFGVAHDPGYPLYSFLGFVWTRVFAFGTIAWRMNVFSALWAAGAVMVAHMLVKRITNNSYAALIAALVLAFSSTFWLFGTTAEVFSLHAFLSLLFLYYLVCFYYEHSRRYLYLTAFAFSLSIAHHHTIILWLPGALLIVVAARFWRYIDIKTALLATVIAASGFLWYAYIPISQAVSGQYYWNDGSDLQGIVNIFLRKSYGTFDIQVGGAAIAAEDRLNYVPVYVLLLLFNVSVVGGVIALLGIIAGLLKRNVVVIALLLNFFVSGLLFLLYAGLQFTDLFRLGMVEKFSLMSFCIVAVCIGFGGDWITSNKLLEKLFRPTFVPLANMTVKGILLIFPLYLFISHWPALNLRDYWGGWAIGHDTFLNIPPNAIVGVRTDTMAFNTRYLHEVEKIRSDVVLTSSPRYPAFAQLETYIKVHELHTTKSVDDPLFVQDLLENNRGEVPFFLRYRTENIPDGTFFHPVGKTVEFVNEETFDAQKQLRKVKYFLNNSLFLNEVYRKDTTLPAFARSIDKDYATTLSTIGWFIIAYGERSDAVSVFELGKELDPNAVSHYIGLSFIFRQEGKCDESLAILDSYPLKIGEYNYELLHENRMLYEQCYRDTEKAQEISKLIEEQFGTTND